MKDYFKITHYTNEHKTLLINESYRSQNSRKNEFN